MNERILNALRLALDPAAPDGEQKAAMLGILRIARSAKWTVAEFLRQLGVAEREVPPEPPYGWDVQLPFGKYRGHTVGAITKRDPDYLLWILENFEGLRPALRRAIEAALEFAGA